MEYLYLGDRWTADAYRKIYCRAVRKADGKCIRGKNGNMLVQTAQGRKLVVIARLLRRLDKMKKT